MRRVGIGIAGLTVLAMLALPASSGAVVQTLSNGNSINFGNADPSGTPGDLYPSSVTFPAGTVNDVNVTVTQSHAFPDDLDIALKSPGGGWVVLQSDACQLDASVFHSLSFDDAGAMFLSDTGNCASASNPYKPSNYNPMGVPDAWPPPAPNTVPSTSLATFNGGPSGGDWELYTVDDNTGNGGSISGWSMTLDFTPAPATTPATPVTPVLTPLTPVTPAPTVCKKKKKKKKRSAVVSACKKKKKKKK